MRKRVPLLLVVPLLVFLVSCAAQFPFVASVEQSEMKDLQSLCQQQNIALSEVKAADSLSAAGAALLEKGKQEAAHGYFNRAGVYYRIALTKNAITATEKKIALEEQALSKTREDVNAYQQVLKELKTMELQ